MNKKNKIILLAIFGILILLIVGWLIFNKGFNSTGDAKAILSSSNAYHASIDQANGNNTDSYVACPNNAPHCIEHCPYYPKCSLCCGVKEPDSVYNPN